MKRSFLVFLLIFCGITLNAQSFSKGDVVLNLGIGFGGANNVKVESLEKPEAKKVIDGIVNQKFSFEVGVADFGQWKLGLGGAFSNSYSFGVPCIASGTYDYTYTMDYHVWQGSGYGWETVSSKEANRNGSVNAKCKNHIDDINILLNVSIHREFVKNLDTYLILGMGLSSYSVHHTSVDTPNLASDERHLDYNNKSSQWTYSYNDADHIKWSDGGATARFSMAFALGGRYYLTSKFGLYGEIGLTSGSFKKDANVFNLLSFGATYKF